MIYEDIGGQPVIKCCGTRTIYGGTLILPCVEQTMLAASGGLTL